MSLPQIGARETGLGGLAVEPLRIKAVVGF
jgi:hypothetical protein